MPTQFHWPRNWVGATPSTWNGKNKTEGARAGGFTSGDLRKELEAQTLLGRIGQPEEIATATVFFASAESAWITGETLVIAGGIH